jgi:hypothetical protein
MSLEPGQYHIRVADILNLPPPPGGMYATNNGEGSIVTAEAEGPHENQIVCTTTPGHVNLYPHPFLQFNVHLNPKGGYVILSLDEKTGWAYKENVAEQPIFMSSTPQVFYIEPYKGENDGIY